MGEIEGKPYGKRLNPSFLHEIRAACSYCGRLLLEIFERKCFRIMRCFKKSELAK